MSDSDNAQGPDPFDRHEQHDEDADVVERAYSMDALPEADDYDPDANYEVRVHGGMMAETYDEFGLAVKPVLVDGKDVGRRFIFRNGRFIADVSDQYQLLPHERLAAIADQVAEDLGAVPFSDFDSTETDDDWYISLDNHIIMDNDGRRFHALYAWDEPVDVTNSSLGGEHDFIHIGFAVHNSIDASLGFNVGLFTFRHACQNMVWMGVNGSGMGFDNREVISHHSHQHTAGLTVEPEMLNDLIRSVIMRAGDVYTAYQEWADSFLTVDIVEDLLGTRLPEKTLPDWISAHERDKADDENDLMDVLEAAEENGDLDPDAEDYEERRRRIIRSKMPNQTLWETYNDVTANIWHSETTNDQSKQRKMKELHKVFDPSPADQKVTIG